MQSLEVSGAVRPIYVSLSVKRLTTLCVLRLCTVGGKQNTSINGEKNTVVGKTEVFLLVAEL